MALLDLLKKPSAVRKETPADVPEVPYHASQTLAFPNGTGEFLAKLSEATAFNKTHAGAVIHQFYETLNGLPEELRMRTAITQAKTLGHLTDSEITSSFNSMEQALNDEAKNFEREHANQVQERVAAPQRRVSEIEVEQKRLNDRIQELNREYIEISGGINSAVRQLDAESEAFNAALGQRSDAIEKERQKVTGLLK